MRTTLDIDRALLNEAKQLGGFETFNETIVAALTAVVENDRRKASEIRMAGLNTSISNSPPQTE